MSNLNACSFVGDVGKPRADGTFGTYKDADVGREPSFTFPYSVPHKNGRGLHIDVRVFGNNASVARNKLAPGMTNISVHGRLDTETYEVNGQPQRRYIVIASHIGYPEGPRPQPGTIGDAVSKNAA